MSSLEELQKLVADCKYCQAKLASKKTYQEGDLVLKLPSNPRGIYNMLVSKLEEKQRNEKLEKAKVNAQKNAKADEEDDDDW
jgi:hypothetical protein